VPMITTTMHNSLVHYRFHYYRPFENIRKE
jgi:hypothetical protein